MLRDAYLERTSGFLQCDALESLVRPTISSILLLQVNYLPSGRLITRARAALALIATETLTRVARQTHAGYLQFVVEGTILSCRQYFLEVRLLVLEKRCCRSQHLRSDRRP